MKECTKCRRTLPLSQFPRRKDRGNRPRSHCRDCHYAQIMSPEGKAQHRAGQYRRKYGITVQDYAAMHERQQGCCAICLEPYDSLHVDHDHATGAVRGLLCDPCNRGLLCDPCNRGVGCFRDAPERLIRAAQYLNDNPTGKG